MVLRGPIQWYAIIVNEEDMSWWNAGHCNKRRSLMHLFIQYRNCWECLELSLRIGTVPDRELSDVRSVSKPKEAESLDMVTTSVQPRKEVQRVSEVAQTHHCQESS